MGAHRRYSLRYGPNCRTVCGRLHTRSVCSQHYRIHSQGLRSAQTAASLGRSGFTVGQARWAALVAARVASGPGLWTAAQSSHPARCVGALCSLRRETDGSTDERRATNPCAKSPRRAGHPTPLCMPPRLPGVHAAHRLGPAARKTVRNWPREVPFANDSWSAPSQGQRHCRVCVYSGCRQTQRGCLHCAPADTAPGAQPMRTRCAADALSMRCRCAADALSDVIPGLMGAKHVGRRTRLGVCGSENTVEWRGLHDGARSTELAKQFRHCWKPVFSLLAKDMNCTVAQLLHK